VQKTYVGLTLSGFCFQISFFAVFFMLHVPPSFMKKIISSLPQKITEKEKEEN
jgi:hypothetical protein